MSAKKSSGSRLKNPAGGLTEAGREHFAETEGAHLQPGVMKAEKDMTAEDMKRKGSFLRRHYGRKNPFKLEDAKGQPTRYALQAQAWGEKLPRTAEDIQRLAEKGTKLLEKAGKTEGKSSSGGAQTKKKAAKETKAKSAG